MQELLDLERYPLDQPDSPELANLIVRSQEQLQTNGMFNLHGFVRPAAIAAAAAQLLPLAATASYTHTRAHNVYFEDEVAGLAPDHPALTRFQTTHHTLCDDQMTHTIIRQIYEWRPLVAFLARVMDQPTLSAMADPLARINVIEYRFGEALNWHFDRARYTTTLLIQPAEQGGEFEYSSELRSDTDPNYDGVGRLLVGAGGDISINQLAAGTLNVFAGKNTLHRVSPVRGSRSRLIAVYSYYDRPGVMFSDAERMGFYGRTG